MADLGLDGAAPFEELCQYRGDAAPLATDQDAGGLDAMPAIAAVDHGEAGPRVGQERNLLQCRCRGVATIGVTGKAARADHEAAVEGGRGADPGAKLVAHPL